MYRKLTDRTLLAIIVAAILSVAISPFRIIFITSVIRGISNTIAPTTIVDENGSDDDNDSNDNNDSNDSNDSNNINNDTSISSSNVDDNSSGNNNGNSDNSHSNNSVSTNNDNSSNKNNNSISTSTSDIKVSSSETLDKKEYKVESVVDGDTFKINYNGKLTSVRLIGVNTPETVDPRTTVECFGKEASDYLKQKLTGKTIRIASDNTQSDRDKYDRLLRYAYLDGKDVGLSIISDGYGYEYTYNIPYAHQTAYKNAQKIASANNKGLWSPNTCNGDKETNTDTNSSTSQECNIKGNISRSGEKIYHMPGQRFYDSTKIDTSSGERWFCSEAEAKAAGWRKSKV